MKACLGKASFRLYSRVFEEDRMSLHFKWYFWKDYWGSWHRDWQFIYSWSIKEWVWIIIKRVSSRPSNKDSYRNKLIWKLFAVE